MFAESQIKRSMATMKPNWKSELCVMFRINIIFIMTPTLKLIKQLPTPTPTPWKVFNYFREKKWNTIRRTVLQSSVQNIILPLHIFLIVVNN